MGRWQPGAQGRLQQAAMELITERGYDRVTVAEIAERAGLTERTFFRHFADKREALFAGQDQFGESILAGLAAAPPDVSPLEAAVRGVEAAGTWLDDERRPGARARQAVIDAHPELQERELIKLARVSAAMAAALRDRGVDEGEAVLAADAGMAVFRLAFTRWVADDGEHDLPWHVRSALEVLRAVVG
ncbi:TetR/AcrR family transcriptional regulator [Actinomycetospora termitidis]|uniref:Helix-turn-helix domain-containing protein n=1 Tax=Actinomycetospora termitidis TaxID=3053470 RepID=A0ABT7M532_9PSEU|nr:TetR/AcrR family transcriptional regulator [Actinomycetospora sp. Odt1-22]MDL5154528.1 helix-turn-helix domain-containing protein [Actinomycetospora sp. Odt1-22]